VSYENLTYQKIDIELLTKHLKGLEGRWSIVGSTHEPTAHPNFDDLVLALSDLGMHIELTTNGTLLNKSLVERIAKCNFEKVNISFDGIRKNTYESIRRNANYERAIESILNFKNSVINQDAYFMYYLYFLANASLTLRIAERLRQVDNLSVAFITVIHQIDGWIVKVKLNDPITPQQHGDFLAYMNELGIPYEPEMRIQMALWSLETGQSPIDVMAVRC